MLTDTVDDLRPRAEGSASDEATSTGSASDEAQPRAGEAKRRLSRVAFDGLRTRAEGSASDEAQPRAGEAKRRPVEAT